MAHVITIKYEAPAAISTQAADPICRVFNPTNCAADNSAFVGSYYDTNVDGWGEGTSIASFIAQADAHPGIVAAIKQAMKNGECTIDDATSKDVLYMNEIADSLADQGITITIDETSDTQ